MKSLIEFVKSVFTTSKFQDHIDAYIASKNPKSTAEVEYWLKAYQNEVHKIGTY